MGSEEYFVAASILKFDGDLKYCYGESLLIQGVFGSCRIRLAEERGWDDDTINKEPKGDKDEGFECSELLISVA